MTDFAPFPVGFLDRIKFLEWGVDFCMIKIQALDTKPGFSLTCKDISFVEGLLSRIPYTGLREVFF